jgi:holo-[acyl-carrier protein] synthase
MGHEEAHCVDLGVPRQLEESGKVSVDRGVVVIYGVGTDICDVRRIAATFKRRGERFAEKVLGPHEIGVFRQRLARVESRGISYLATRFSAKEAFAKAIGLVMRMPMTWRDCEVVKTPSGQPQIRLHGSLSIWFDARGLRAHVSLTDETDYAASIVVVEQNENPP